MIPKHTAGLGWLTELACAARKHELVGHAVFLWVEHVAAFAAEFEGDVFLFGGGDRVGGIGGGGGGCHCDSFGFACSEVVLTYCYRCR